VLGVFELKTDWDYAYNEKGNLVSVTEKNLSLDSLLINLAAQNSAKIEYKDERPVKVTRTLGAAPPVFETTEYTYSGNTENMQKTVYRKCGFDTSKMKVSPSETITTEYGKNIPWSGRKKYKFEFNKTVTNFMVYDEVEKKSRIDGSRFMKMNMIEKGMFMKNIVTYYRNEQKGPGWRMGELPDTPEPFMIYKDYAWYK
jgi:hypothetical protein